MAAKNGALTGLGTFTIVLSLVYLAAAYGLLKIESWSPYLTKSVLAVSIPLSVLFIWLDPSNFNVVALTISIVIDLIVIWLLQDRDIKQLYQPITQQQAVS
jgi:uncharacterized membrane protein (DUF2068 family)